MALPIPVSYDLGVTALSIVPAVLAVGVALHVVARPVATTTRLPIGGTLGRAAGRALAAKAMELRLALKVEAELSAGL